MEQTSDMVRFESDEDYSDCCVLGGVDWKGNCLGVGKDKNCLDHSWDWDGMGKRD